MKMLSRLALLFSVISLASGRSHNYYDVDYYVGRYEQQTGNGVYDNNGGQYFPNPAGATVTVSPYNTGVIVGGASNSMPYNVAIHVGNGQVGTGNNALFDSGTGTGTGNNRMFDDYVAFGGLYGSYYGDYSNLYGGLDAFGDYGNPETLDYGYFNGYNNLLESSAYNGLSPNGYTKTRPIPGANRMYSPPATASSATPVNTNGAADAIYVNNVPTSDSVQISLHPSGIVAIQPYTPPVNQPVMSSAAITPIQYQNRNTNQTTNSEESA